MNKAISINLDTGVDVGAEAVVVPGDEIKFSRKNSLTYSGLLSSYRKMEGNGWMTTTNQVVRLLGDDGSQATIDINGKTYKLDSSTKHIATYEIEPSIAGNIQSVTADETYVYYIIKDNLNNWYKVQYDNISQGAVVEDFIFNADEKVKTAYFIYGTSYYAVAETSGVDIYSIDGTLIQHLDLPHDRPSNNGWWLDSENWVFGRDDKDQFYAWATGSYEGAVESYRYMGCVDERGNVTGEPFPAVDISGRTVTTAEPERLPNGVLKWTRLSNDTASLLSYISEFDMTAWDFTTLLNYQSISPNKSYTLSLNESGLKYWVTMIRRSSIDYVEKENPGFGNADGFTVINSWIQTDPGQTPGIFWQSTAGQYDNVFPSKYFFTNIQSNKGYTYSYGKGWTRTYALTVGLVQFSKGNTKIFDPYTAGLYFVESTASGMKLRSLDANDNGNSQVYNTTTAPCIDGKSTSSIVIDSTKYVGGWRRHPFTSAQKVNQAWNQWLWQIGGRNDSEDGMVDLIPMTVDYGKFSVLIYNGYTTGFAYNKCMVNSPNNEIETWTFREIGDKIIISTKENVYVIGPGEFKIRKVADYIFSTNCLTEYNTLQEARNGVIELVRAFVPYNMSFDISNYWREFDFRAPDDGSAANDTWFEAAGINANLNDEYLACSFLLPAVQLPLYVFTSDLTTFDKNIIAGAKPILIPTTDGTLFDDEELMLYYTHSQSSTDITYRETIKGGDSYFDSLYKDNSWWLSSQTIMFPIGVASRFSGINYLSSTVDLEGNYTARLYVNNNTAYLIFNIAEQVYYGSTIFTIYTNNYYYDGEAIYSIIGSNNEFVCYAVGLQFLANSGTEAYFYSPSEKCLYLFTGSNTLAKSQSISQLNGIKDATFNSGNQTMYILDNDSKLFVLNSTTSALFDNDSIDHIESSARGAVLVGDGTYRIYSAYNGDVIPLDLETEWIGDTTALNKFGYADVQLFNNGDSNNAAIKLLFSTKDGDDIIERPKTIKICKSDWKGTYLRLRLVPENPTGQAFKFRLYTEDDVHIMSLGIAFEQISAQPPSSSIDITV